MSASLLLLPLLLACSVGEKRILRIPPHMGYGDRGAGADIPGELLLLLC
jgi:FKBP-type peptidyl-prolyl cis-trans isomerase